MKVLALGLLCLLATVVNSTPMKRNKRAVMTMAGGFPFGAGAFAGAGGAFAGPGGAFTGGYAGWPFFPSPWDYPRPPMMPMPMVPWPTFIPLRNWYEGENVCKSTVDVDDLKVIQDFFSIGTSPGTDFSHESEQCKGDASKYACLKASNINGETKFQLIKYECCHGFVRNPSGSGCIENTPTNETPGGRNQDTYYYFPQPTTTSSSRTGVENVRPQ